MGWGEGIWGCGMGWYRGVQGGGGCTWVGWHRVVRGAFYGAGGPRTYKQGVLKRYEHGVLKIYKHGVLKRYEHGVTRNRMRREPANSREVYDCSTKLVPI